MSKITDPELSALESLEQQATPNIGWEGVIRLKFNRITKTFEPFKEPKKSHREDPYLGKRRE